MLSRYFPELESGARALGASAFVLDGEITIANGDGFSFDALLLLQRIHPAATRVERLARETPALMIAFDLLAGVDGASLLDHSLRSRRPKLEAFARRFFPTGGSFRLSPATTSLHHPKRWLEQVGSTLDGIIAKRLVPRHSDFDSLVESFG
jgi:ATP-dependent DNA ligase